MALKAQEIKRNKKILSEINTELTATCNWYFILSDTTRMKILLLLLTYGDTICATDIASSIGVSVSAISHQMKTLEMYNMVTREKCGKTVCYTPTKEVLKEKKFIEKIRRRLY